MFGFVSTVEYNKLCDKYNELLDDFKTLTIQFGKVNFENECLHDELRIEKDLSKINANINDELCADIKDFKDKIRYLETPVHNPRNAGRKQRATPEQVQTIFSLREQGLSLAKIAKSMTLETGSNWNKTTVKNIINRKTINKCMGNGSQLC